MFNRSHLIPLLSTLFLSAFSASAQVIIPLTGDEANSSPPGFSSSIVGTLNDPFAYTPLDPTSVSPNLSFGADRSYHGAEPNSGLVVLTYTLNHTISNDPTEQRFVFDLWGRRGGSNATIESRDDDFDVEIFNGTTSLAQLTGLEIDADKHTRADFRVLPAGTEITRIVITARQSQTGATASSQNAFTLQEVRAAVLPDPDTYVAQATAFSPTNPNTGDTVTWNPGQPNEKAGLIFGTNAFTQVQAAIDAASIDGIVFIDEGDYIKGSTILIEKNLTLLGENRETTRLLREETADPHSVVTSRASVTLENLTISGGLSEIEEGGGGIDFRNTLTVNNCTVSANSCTIRESGGGIGGIGTVTIDNSLISDNESTGNQGGGGIGGDGATVFVNDSIIRNNISNSSDSGGGIGGRRMRITVNDSTISNNTAQGGIDSGGGIGGNATTITVNRSLIIGNTSEEENSGGGIGGDGNTYFVNDSLVTGNTANGRDSGAGLGGRTPNITARNTTISGNTATDRLSGGGIGGAGIRSITVTNCTVTANTASGPDSTGGIGGRLSANAEITATNTIVAGNSATGRDPEPELRGPLTDIGGNLIGIPDGLTIADILLPLADNGGPTETHALAETSPAINIGLNNALSDVTTDQRGEGFPRILNTLIDAGAVEADTNFPLDPNGDSDGDGLALILELAIGTEPNQADFSSPQLPTIGLTATEGGPASEFIFGRGSSPLPGTILVVEFSTTLENGSFEELYRFSFDTGVGIQNPRNDLAARETQESFRILLLQQEKAFFRIGAILSE